MLELLLKTLMNIFELGANLISTATPIFHLGVTRGGGGGGHESF